MVTGRGHGVHGGRSVPGRPDTSSLDSARLIPGIHQLSSVTAFDRYPTLFKALAGKMTPRRILSFGCSTGEECATARLYWPEADIVGVDVKETSLQTAQERHSCFRFRHVSELATLGKFDLVLALSVLCRHRDTKDREFIADVYPFAMFEEAVGQLVARLAPRGVIAIVNANYRFIDTRHGVGFRSLFDQDFYDDTLHARTRLFSAEGRMLPEQTARAVFGRE